MDISNGAGGIDSSKLMDYFTKDFLKDLGKMAVLRDELEKRQGAMSAVNAALKAKEEADAYAVAKKVEADANLETAKVKNEESKTKKADLDAREKALDARQGEFEKDTAKSAKDLNAREKSLAAMQDALLSAQNDLKLAQDKLETDRSTLDARVKAFQDKVASINV